MNKYTPKNKLSEFFFRLVRPSTWYNALETSDKVDEFVNKLIDEDCFERFDGLRSVFKYKGQEIELWNTNFPYSYGSIESVDNRKFSLANYGPSVSTRYRLAAYLAAVSIDRIIKAK